MLSILRLHNSTATSYTLGISSLLVTTPVTHFVVTYHVDEFASVAGSKVQKT